MCSEFIHMTGSPSAIFPNEILDLILRASWSGIRLGLTCRQLRAKITDELFDQWVTQDTITYKEKMFLTLSRLPNGTFHGKSLMVESGNEAAAETVEYNRGRIMQSTMWVDGDMRRKDIIVRGYTCYWADDDIYICDCGADIKIIRNRPVSLLESASIEWIARHNIPDGDVDFIYITDAAGIFPMTR